MANLFKVSTNVENVIDQEKLAVSQKALVNYLHCLSKLHDDLHISVTEHDYAKTGTHRPSKFGKPTTNINFRKKYVSKRRYCGFSDDDESGLVDVTTIDSRYDVPKVDWSTSRRSMEEFQKLANFVRPEDCDNWEEKIKKAFWSPLQIRMFNKVLKTLNSERLVRLSKSNDSFEPVLRRISIDTAASRFREILASVNWDIKLSQWLHGLLFDHLPQDYLAIYLDILQALQQKIPQLIDKMIAVQPTINSKGNSSETFGPLLKKSWDPLDFPVERRSNPLPGNPIIIVIPSVGDTNTRRQSKWIARLELLGPVIPMNLQLDSNSTKMSVNSYTEQLVHAIKAKIAEIKSDFSGKSVVLIGFHTEAAMAFQVAQIENVSAIVCLGLPINTVDGRRGSCDDMLIETTTPVLIVNGSNSMLSKIYDLEHLRQQIFADTEIVTVGSADEHLKITTSTKILEKMSQAIVDFTVVHLIEIFLKRVLAKAVASSSASSSSTSSSIGTTTTGTTHVPSLVANCGERKSLPSFSRKRKLLTSSNSLQEENYYPQVKRTLNYATKEIRTAEGTPFVNNPES